MIGSGRCHGPGCTQTAVVEFWCSELCQAQWDRQAAGLPVSMPEVQQRIADALDQTLADVTQTRVNHAPPGSLYEDIDRAYEHIEAMPPAEPVKLTRGQWEALRVANPPLMSRYGVGGVLGDLSGVPIELVEDERDSTLYRAPVEAVGVFETFDEPPTFGPLPPAVEGDSEERVCEPSAPDPSRGWLSRWLDRLFGRTT